MGKEEYLKTVTEQMRCAQAREAVEEELCSHIEEAARTYEEYGLSKEDACKRAVDQMGDPVEVGVELDRIHRPRFEWKMFGMILALSIMGLVVQFFLERQTGTNVFWPQLLYTGLGLGAMLLMYFLDYSILGRYAFVCYWGYLGLLTAAVLAGSVMGYRFVNGILYRFAIPLYLTVPFFGAVLYRYRGSGRKGLLRCGLLGCIPVLFCMYPLRSVGYRINLALILFLMLCFAVWKGWFAVKRKRALAVMSLAFVGIPAAGVALGMKYGFAAYQRARILSILLPGKYEERDYMSRMAREALGRCRLVGGSGSEFFLKTETAHTDFVFLNLLAGFGILAGILVILLLACLVGKVFRISLRQQNQLGQMVGVGCGLVFCVQILECVGMNLGLEGVRSTLFLPFFSYGNGSAVVFYLLLGLVLSVYRYKDIPRKQKAGMHRKTFS